MSGTNEFSNTQGPTDPPKATATLTITPANMTPEEQKKWEEENRKSAQAFGSALGGALLSKGNPFDRFLL